MKFWRRRKDEELDAEIQSHLDEAIRDRIARGEAPDEARANALREFGNVGLVKEVTREMWGWAWVEQLLQDLRFGLRMLRKNPGFSLIAILTLALGIGATTAIFSVVNAVLLRSLPYHEPDRLVLLSYYRERVLNDYANAAEYLEWRTQTKAFAQMAAYRFDVADLTGNGEPERLKVGYASADCFATLGVTPARGRAFTPEEDRAGNAKAVILTNGYWQRHFGGAPQVLGRTLTVGGQSRTVVGIMPSGFRLTDDAELWLPLALDVNQQLSRQGNAVRVKVIARLKPGATPEVARAELAAVLAQQRQHFPQIYSRFGDIQARVIELNESLVGNVRRALWVLFGAVGFVLLIACTNVANLLLARGAVRQRELAIRAAVGAGRWRLMRQLLTESLLLALAGGVAGWLLARWGIKLLVAFSPDSIARIRETTVDGRTLVFTCLVVVLAGLLAGILPALQASQTDVNETLKAQSSPTGQRGARRLLPALMITELALALVLLVGAGLLGKSYVRLLVVPKGFHPAGVLTGVLSPSVAKYPFQSPQRDAYHREVLARVQALPGIRSAALASLTPLEGGYGRTGFQIEGRTAFPKEETPMADENIISPEYLSTMGIPLLAGRAFTAADNSGGPEVVLINETFARRFFPNENPIGQRLLMARTKTIVGVVSDTRHQGLDQDVRLEIYIPSAQAIWNRNYVLAVRVADQQNNPSSLAIQIAAIRNQLRVLEPNEPVNEIIPLEQRLSNSRAVATRRFQLTLFSVFAAVALVIATVGIYGVISYSVSQRTQEIGLRMALGAQTSDVVRLIVWRGMRLALLGVTLGVVAALALTRVMTKLLFQVTATDPLTYTQVAVLLFAVALIANYVPAQRATKVDPLIALRHE
ncbi:MAG: ABC transporter permease [Acidobacteria bacterium]|nr:ABC transporter permease [Acidobacteriota bacterium]